MKFILCNEFFVTLHFISDVSIVLNCFMEIKSLELNWNRLLKEHLSHSFNFYAQKTAAGDPVRAKEE